MVLCLASERVQEEDMEENTSIGEPFIQAL